MAFPGAQFPWNGIPARVRMPIAGGTTRSETLTVPRGAKVITIHVPALVGTGATVKLQTLAPTETVEATQVWSDISVFDLTDGSFEVLDALVESTAVTIPISATGSGNLSFIASEDQSSVPSTIPVFFGFDD